MEQNGGTGRGNGKWRNVEKKRETRGPRERESAQWGKRKAGGFAREEGWRGGREEGEHREVRVNGRGPKEKGRASRVK